METIDRKAVNTALAKAIAFKQCGKDKEAEAWARQLIELLQCANILKLFTIFFGIAMLFTACSPSGHHIAQPERAPTRKVKVRVIPAGHLTTAYIDTIYSVGDTVRFPNSQTYCVILADRANDVHDVKYMRDYQIECDSNCSYLYDGNRLVGRLPYSDDDNFSMLVTEDNR
jgi:hypothetical protein